MLRSGERNHEIRNADREERLLRIGHDQHLWLQQRLLEVIEVKRLVVREDADTVRARLGQRLQDGGDARGGGLDKARVDGNLS